MATVLDIIQGINQAAANAWDGAHDERIVDDGTPKKAGLKREEGDLNIEARVMDGFNVNFHGDKLVVKYQSEVKLSDIHEKGFENEVVSSINDIVKYLKKEYKRITGDTLTLTKLGEPDILAQHLNKSRTWIQSSQVFKIGGLDGVEPVKEGSDADRLDTAIKDWLKLGKNDQAI